MEKVFVTTDQDYFNSADPARFFVAKDQVKVLPEKLTLVIEKALEQGLLREATDEEIRIQKEKDLEEEKARKA